MSDRLATRNVFRKRRESGAPNKELHREVAREVKAVLKDEIEEKNFDVRAFASSAQSTPSIFTISSVSQGVGGNSRVGDTLKYRSLQFFFNCYIQGTGGTNDFTNLVRLTIFKWLPTVIVAGHPIVTDIYQDGSAAQSAVSTPFQYDSESNFKILFDKTWPLCGTGPSQICINRTMPLKGKAQFLGATSSLASNQIFAIVSSDSILASHPLYDFTSRILFEDA
jgi:hypothetical protein